MDRDRFSGTIKQAEGALKKAAGTMMGDSRLRTEGQFNQTQGRAQSVMGGVKDALRDANRSDR